MEHTQRTYICAHCGVESLIKQYRKSKYCGFDCFFKARKTGVTKKCVVCDKEFYVNKSRAEKAIACSSGCQIKYQGRNKVSMVCECCGITYLISPSFAIIGNRRFCSMKCRDSSEAVKEMLLRLNAAQSKSNPNKFETMAYELLDSIGVKYIGQYIVGGKFTVDAYVPDKNIVIQLDGDYWHGNPAKFKALDKRQRKRVALDKSQDQYMRACGIEVIRFWQSDFDNMDQVIQKIKESCL